MTPLAARPHRNPEVADLGRRFLAQLAEEEAALTRLRGCLLQVHHALCHGDSAALAAAFSWQSALADEAAGRQAQREQLQREAAGVLRIAPESFTLSLLCRRAPLKTRERLEAARDRLRALAALTADLHRRTTTLTAHCYHFLQNTLQDITGAGPCGTRYGPDGTPRAAGCGTLVEMRG